MAESQPQSQQSSITHWSLNEFFKKSIKLLKENPKLLLLSLALMILASSGGSGGNYSSGGSSTSETSQQEQATKLEDIVFDDAGKIFDDDIQDTEDEVSTQDPEEFTAILSSLGINQTPDEIEETLVSIKNILTIVGESFINSINRLSPWMKTFFPLGALVLGIFLVLFSVAVSLWIKVAMMCGIDQAVIVGNNQWKLVDVTKKAGKRIKPMVWMSIIPLFKIILWSIALFIGLALLISGVALLFDNRAVMGLIFLGGGLVLLYYSINKVFKISIAQILGYWNIAINDNIQPAKIAFEQSLVLLDQKGSVGKIISLAFVHLIVFNLLLPLVALLPLGSAGFAFSGEVFQSIKQTTAHSKSDFSQVFDIITASLTPQWIVVLIVTAIVTSLLLFAITLIATPIKHANWYWAYQYLKSQGVPNYQQEKSEEK